MTKLLNDALKLYERNISVIPIEPGTKKPLVGLVDWNKRRLPRGELEHYFTNGYDLSAFGVVCGSLSDGLAILDFDGQNWQQAFEHVCHCWPELCGAPHVRTGSDKRHIWLRLDDIPDNRKRNKKFKRGNAVIEFRANRVQTLAPPSRHPNGDCYQWLNTDSDLPIISYDELFTWLNHEWCNNPPEVSPSNLQLNLLQSNMTTEYGILPARTQAFLMLKGEQAPGWRNDELFAASQQFKASGRPLSLALEKLGRKALEIGLSSDEAYHTIRSAYNGAHNFLSINRFNLDNGGN